MSSSPNPFQDNFDSHEPRPELESPFLNEEYLAEKARTAPTWRTPVSGFQLESPFLQAFEEGWGANSKLNLSVGMGDDNDLQNELEKASFEENSVRYEAESFPQNDNESQHYEMLLELEEDANNVYYVNEVIAQDEADNFPQDEAESQHYEMLLELEEDAEDIYSSGEEATTFSPKNLADYFSEEEKFLPDKEWDTEEEEFTFSEAENSYLEETPILGLETLFEAEQWSPSIIPDNIIQQVRRMVDKGVFHWGLLTRFASGKIWNEDHLALEILFQRQPKLRPNAWETLPEAKLVKLFPGLAMKYQRDLKPIREQIVRPLFGNPSNFKVDPVGECQVQDLRLAVKQLGRLRGGEIRGKVWYKRDAERSPRSSEKIDSIVLHHMAYNIGNNVNNYKKVGAHFIVTADGQIAQLYDTLDFINASNGFNPRSVAIEFAGNFPDHRYRWWKSREKAIPDRCYLNPAQIRAGRCLLVKLKALLPGIKYLYAHRQSSASRENDPGSDVWYSIGEWALANLNLTDQEPQTHIGSGQPIPVIWRQSRSATSITPTTPNSIPTNLPASSPSTSANKPTAELVRFIQRVLNSTEKERLDDDGDLGRFTRGALERFRKKYNLGGGGVLDDKTLLALAQRALEEIAQQSIFSQLGVLDAKTEQALITFKSERGLGFNAMLDAATRTAITDALARRAGVPSTPASSQRQGLPATGTGSRSLSEKITSGGWGGWKGRQNSATAFIAPRNDIKDKYDLAVAVAARVETGGAFDKVQMYDKGILSWGIKQWTLHRGSLQKLLGFIKIKLAKSLWTELFSGIDIQADKILINGTPYSTPRKDNDQADLALRKVFRGKERPEDFDKDRVDHWLKIFARAGRHPEIQKLQFEYALQELKRNLNKQLGQVLKGIKNKKKNVINESEIHNYQRVGDYIETFPLALVLFNGMETQNPKWTYLYLKRIIDRFANQYRTYNISKWSVNWQQKFAQDLQKEFEESGVACWGRQALQTKASCKKKDGTFRTSRTEKILQAFQQLSQGLGIER